MIIAIKVIMFQSLIRPDFPFIAQILLAQHLFDLF